MTIVWRDAMSVGNDTIDTDHKQLFAIINEFEAAPDFARAETAAKKLYRYTQEHFRREEALQQMLRYPKASPHADEHGRILSALTELIRTRFLQKPATPEAYADTIARLTDLMRQWIVGHVMQTDREMRPYLGEK